MSTPTKQKLPRGVGYVKNSRKFRGAFRVSGKAYFTRMYRTVEEARQARDDLFAEVSARLRGVLLRPAPAAATPNVVESAAFSDEAGRLPELPLHDGGTRRTFNETSRARAW